MNPFKFLRFQRILLTSFIPLGVCAKSCGKGSVWFSNIFLGSHSWLRRHLFFPMDGGLFWSLIFFKKFGVYSRHTVQIANIRRHLNFGSASSPGHLDSCYLTLYVIIIRQIHFFGHFRSFCIPTLPLFLPNFRYSYVGVLINIYLCTTFLWALYFQ